ncbi:MAG: hypothetical protein IPG05_03095 [Gemmatimonadetes bacterium]|jgi:hypothetical protein|nr:hypothetical protein [Gemmatimonadota bacterium]
MRLAVEDIIAILCIFGGGTMIVLSFSPVGKAFADRLRHGAQPLPALEPDPAVYDELDRLRLEVNELHERVEFTERLLAKGDRPDAASGGQ